MIDFRQERITGRLKICPEIPPLVIYVETRNASGELVKQPELRPVLCYREGCEYFCEAHGMCMKKCGHMMEHGMFIEDCEDDSEDICG